jgi:hypothetical protein
MIRGLLAPRPTPKLEDHPLSFIWTALKYLQIWLHFTFAVKVQFRLMFTLLLFLLAVISLQRNLIRRFFKWTVLCLAHSSFGSTFYLQNTMLRKKKYIYIYKMLKSSHFNQNITSCLL